MQSKILKGLSLSRSQIKGAATQNLEGRDVSDRDDLPSA